jgi:DNA mismatch repair protein MutS
MAKASKPTTKKVTNPDNEEGIFSEYFKYTREHQLKYGQKTIVLMQVGSFFEVYGVRNLITGQITGSLIVELSEVCQLNIPDKKATYGTDGVIVGGGFQLYMLDKYLVKLIDAGYTVPIYTQDKDGKKDGKTIIRSLYKVVSPGTYLSCEPDNSPQITNNIMCIWMNTFKSVFSTNSRETIIYGVAVANIVTGKSSMFEYSSPFYMDATTFDELERYVSVFSPSEVILLSPFDDKQNNTIMQYVGMRASSIHFVDTKDVNNSKVSNCSTQKYIKQILSTFFGEEAYDICAEFREHEMASQTFCYLMNFIQEHNPDLIRKVSIPEFTNSSNRVILANHTLMQLNILDDSNNDGKHNGNLSSVMKFMNRCCSPMGRRKFQSQLTSPTFNEEWLNNEYSMISTMLLPNNYELIDAFRKELRELRDIEKISRQLIQRKLYPNSIAQLYHSIQTIQRMNASFIESPEICDYLCSDFIKDIGNEFSSFQYINDISDKITQFLDNHLHIHLCESITSMTSFDENIIRSGISDVLDSEVSKYNKNISIFDEIRKYFNECMQQNENSPDTEFVKMHETDKSGRGLQMTLKRSAILKQILTKQTASRNGIFVIQNIFIDIKDIQFKKPTSTSTIVDIEFPLLDRICRELFTFKEIINRYIAEIYMVLLGNLEADWFPALEQLANYAAKVDVLQCKTYLSKKYNYCRPEIVSDSPKSFIDANDLRHCLIEHLQQNELYVCNSVGLGSEYDGILLYGTNAVGKTSLIRALGVATILAQSGMFVPCSTFRYKPYVAIYSRILGNDNIFKGLSTFAVEMSELRIILKMADENSLILGDELCSGTETESALSIFVAGLMDLSTKKCSFIFATHFHEIVDYDEVRNMRRVVMKHMTVSYNRQLECLIYDRKLKDGSGPRIYGLEVCKSLYLTDEFLDKAYAIRNKYFPETRGELSNKPSSYNSEKIRGMCELCKTHIGEETHHLQPQKDADEDGFIGSFHKNHVANLLTVCEACHDRIHSADDLMLTRRKTTNGYALM